MVDLSVSLSTTYVCCEFTIILRCIWSYYPLQTGFVAYVKDTFNGGCVLRNYRCRLVYTNRMMCCRYMFLFYMSFFYLACSLFSSVHASVNIYPRMCTLPYTYVFLVFLSLLPFLPVIQGHYWYNTCTYVSSPVSIYDTCT